MTEDLTTKVLNTHSIECRGVPTYNGLCLAEPVAALLTTRVDGTVEVACPYYVKSNEVINRWDHSSLTDKGTCRASERGSLSCTYRKIKPDQMA